ncbi:MAG: DUF4364 family protein [Clostridiales bacterium]|nr:DUF4364 family protein [Clostridiales bacterium]
MIERKSSDTENKLLLLYAIRELKSCTNLQLWQFVTESELMDYLSFQLSLGELVQDGDLMQSPHPIGLLYTVTPSGEKNVLLFDRKIPFSLKTLIRKKALLWKDRFQKEQHYLSDYYKNDEGKYVLHLTLLEHKEPMFHLSLSLPERQNCAYYAKGWPQHSSALYSHFMALFGEGFVMEEKEEPTAPSLQTDQILQIVPYVPFAQTLITPLSPGAFFEGQWNLPGGNFFSLSALLPSEEMAKYFAARWAEKKNTFLLFFHDTMGK